MVLRGIDYSCNTRLLNHSLALSYVNWRVIYFTTRSFTSLSKVTFVFVVGWCESCHISSLKVSLFYNSVKHFFNVFFNSSDRDLDFSLQTVSVLRGIDYSCKTCLLNHSSPVSCVGWGYSILLPNQAAFLSGLRLYLLCNFNQEGICTFLLS